MSGHESYPPPGGSFPPPGGPPPPQQPPSSYPAYPAYPVQPGLPGPPPGMLGAAHKPGAIPLRPLSLGDLYDGAFRIVRYNPRATVGIAVLVTAVTMLFPVLVTAVLTWTVGISYDVEGSSSSGDDLGSALSSISQALGSAAQGLGTLFVTGGIAHVVMAAAVGRRLGLGEVWRATHGKRWRLVGLTVVQVLAVGVVLGLYALMWVAVVLGTDGAAVPIVFGVVSVPLLLALLAWAWTRFAYLSGSALMLEDVGIFGALGRAYRLTGGAFWRTFGIGLLTALLVGFVGSIIAVPVTIVGVVGVLVASPEYQLLVLVVVQAVAGVLSAALTTPFTAAVSTLQYVDLRMRKEAFDVELMNRAGITAS